MDMSLGMVMLLVQATSVSPPSSPAISRTAPPDSAQLARLRARIEGQSMIHVTVGSDQLELTRPRLLDSAIAYRDAWSDRLAGRDTALANPLPLSRVSVVQVRGRQVLPSVLGASVSMRISALASMLLTKAVNSNSGIDGNEILRVTAVAFGVGAAVGAADGALRTRWVTAWRRTDRDGQGERRGGDSNPR